MSRQAPLGYTAAVVSSRREETRPAEASIVPAPAAVVSSRREETRPAEASRVPAPAKEAAAKTTGKKREEAALRRMGTRMHMPPPEEPEAVVAAAAKERLRRCNTTPSEVVRALPRPQKAPPEEDEKEDEKEVRQLRRAGTEMAVSSRPSLAGFTKPGGMCGSGGRLARGSLLAVESLAEAAPIATAVAATLAAAGQKKGSGGGSQQKNQQKTVMPKRDKLNLPPKTSSQALMHRAPTETAQGEAEEKIEPTLGKDGGTDEGAQENQERPRAPAKDKGELRRAPPEEEDEEDEAPLHRAPTERA